MQNVRDKILQRANHKRQILLEFVQIPDVENQQSLENLAAKSPKPSSNQ
jgi:hypothetical protein